MTHYYSLIALAMALAGAGFALFPNSSAIPFGILLIALVATGFAFPRVSTTQADPTAIPYLAISFLVGLVVMPLSGALGYYLADLWRQTLLRKKES